MKLYISFILLINIIKAISIITYYKLDKYEKVFSKMIEISSHTLVENCRKFNSFTRKFNKFHVKTVKYIL